MAHRYHGQIGANLILGGVDCTGNHLYNVGPYGSVDKMPYLAMGMPARRAINVPSCVKLIGRFLTFFTTLLCVHEGSGDLAALGILEDGFKHGMEVAGWQTPSEMLSSDREEFLLKANFA